MSIERKKRIDLSPYDSTWVDSFILVATKGFKETMSKQAEFRKLDLKLAKAEREIVKLNKQIEATNDVAELDQLYAEFDKVEEKINEISLTRVEGMKKYVQDSFRAGHIFDTELNAGREMTKEDIEMFDVEVLGAITSEMTGTAGKK